MNAKAEGFVDLGEYLVLFDERTGHSVVPSFVLQ
jgi:hypothetical protein